MAGIGGWLGKGKEPETTRLSASPTRPRSQTSRGEETFDVASLYQGPVGTTTEGSPPNLDEKLRRAYFWITNYAIISPFYDIEFNDGPPQTYLFGDKKSRLTLPTDQSYSSFVLLPLLTLALQRKCLLIGGPGRGKTASAILMGVLAGYPLTDLKRAIQHGQPQMTITDLLGNPLPSSLVKAERFEEVTIAWRQWLDMRVKIIDEYNRIPTRTQSALLTLMADNYAEIYDQIHECPEAAWYLTANDEAGGGTYQVIEALSDRIDVVVPALHFNSRFLGELLDRLESGARPEEEVPGEIIFTVEELRRLQQGMMRVGLPRPLRRRIEFFSSHLEFCEPAAQQMEYKTKDAVKVSGIDFREVMAGETGKDRLQELGLQSQNGISVRGLMTILAYVKGLAYFRGNTEVEAEDVRQILPFVLRDKLRQYGEAPFFAQPGMACLRVDRVSWVRSLWDASCKEYDRLDLDREDPVVEVELLFQKGLEGLSESETRARMVKIERILTNLSSTRKLYAHQFDDLLKLKYYHQRYTNYMQWLKWSQR